MNLPPRTQEEQAPYKDLTGRVKKLDQHYFEYGGFSEIYRGILTETNELVAIKTLRGVHTNKDTLEVITRRLNRESRVWHTLDHKYVLKFLGICNDLGPSPVLISPLCNAGQAIQYVQNHPEANRPQMIFRIAQGLQYLHSKSVLHGDLKPQNILIDDLGNPLLCDFGRSKIINQSGFTTIFSGAARYMAPELLNLSPEEDNEDDVENKEDVVEVEFSPVLTRKTDVYGFGMVGLEIITGKSPFHAVKHDAAVIAKIRDGMCPAPKRYNVPAEYESTWSVLKVCWNKDPEARPTMDAVVQRLL